MTTRSPHANSLRADALELGTLLSDRYLITRFIGKGGFALVYEAYDKTIGRSVAVKVHNSFDSEDVDEAGAKVLQDRFEREAKAAAQIGHPNVVAVYEMGFLEETRQPFIVMEYLEGHDLLKALRKSGPMEPARILPLFCRALAALAAGHKQNIVHKDLKLANLFLVNPGTPQEDIRVLDFGIAVASDMGARLTATGFMAGTPEYLAPEYIYDQSVSPAVDVYQMGLLLVELLSARSVIQGNTPLACLPLHLNRKLLISDELLACDALRPILLRALELKPANRYPEAGAFLADLQEVNPADLPILGPKAPQTFLCDYLEKGLGQSAQPAGSNLPPELAPTVALMPSGEPHHPPSPGVNKALIGAVVAGLVLMFLGGIGFIIAATMFRTGQSAELNEAPKPVAVKAQPKTEPKAEPKAKPPAPITKVADKAPEAIEAPPKTPVEVSLVTAPSRAKVYRDKELLGTTPYAFSFSGHDDKAVVLTLKRRNYKNTTLELRPSDGPTRDVILERARRSPSKGGDGMKLAD